MVQEGTAQKALKYVLFCYSNWIFSLVMLFYLEIVPNDIT